ncbi:hypothetical protein PVAP13_8KG212701 [Panicum virgatum]|uniref:Uncharacterized protein n=1 Tax=Panicum virgatum TaxID=38727 RepID=A0A8T0PSM5_PANVG|nr:hypothetical protein PVAP13_8KG212701 [Panicum virgatum]
MATAGLYHPNGCCPLAERLLRLSLARNSQPAGFKSTTCHATLQRTTNPRAVKLYIHNFAGAFPLKTAPAGPHTVSHRRPTHSKPPLAPFPSGAHPLQSPPASALSRAPPATAGSQPPVSPHPSVPLSLPSSSSGSGGSRARFPTLQGGGEP